MSMQREKLFTFDIENDGIINDEDIYTYERIKIDAEILLGQVLGRGSFSEEDCRDKLYCNVNFCHD